MDSLAGRLDGAVQAEEPALRAIQEALAAARSEPAAWSKKQELGHLIDSAANNRARFIVAALENGFAAPSYDGRGWVDLGGYAEMPWHHLIDLWKMSNQALAVVLDRIPPASLSAPCRIGGADPVTLRFVIEDYILHMQHHLDHILGREHVTGYPGAAVGV